MKKRLYLSLLFILLFMLMLSVLPANAMQLILRSNAVGNTIYHKVTFSVGDEVIVKQFVMNEGELVLPQPPAAETGKRFAGWFDGTTQYKAGDTVTSALNLAATFESIAKYVLTIQYQYGRDIEDANLAGKKASGDEVRTYANGETGFLEVSSPLIQGYAADQSTVRVNIANLTDSQTITVTYREANTTYKVEHYLEDHTPDSKGEYGFTCNGTRELNLEDLTQEFEGITGSTVIPEAVDIEGFTWISSESGIINSDGTTKLKVYYSRNQCHVIFDPTEGTPVQSAVGKHGSSITLPSTSKTGYTFNGWSDQDGNTMSNEASYVIPIDYETHLTAEWESDTVYYKIVRWIEKPNLGNEEFDPVEDGISYYMYRDEFELDPDNPSAHLSGTAGETPDIESWLSKNNNRYITLPNKTHRIAEYKGTNGDLPSLSGAGDTVINLYYNRILFTYEFDLDGKTMSMNGKDYASNSEKYCVYAKYEQNVSNVWPVPNKAKFNTYYQNWVSSNCVTPGSWATMRVAIDDAMVPSSANYNSNLAYKTTLKLTSSTKEGERQVRYYFEELPEENRTGTLGTDYIEVSGGSGEKKRYFIDPAFSQTQIFSTLSPKTILGMTAVNSASGNTNHGPGDKDYQFAYNRNRFTLNFDTNLGQATLNDGVSTPDDVTRMYQQSLAGLEPEAWVVDETNMSLDGITYYFTGWYGTNECDEDDAFNFDNLKMPNGNLTAYAGWEGRLVNVQIHYAEDDVETYELRIGTSLEDNNETIRFPEREGYDFANWYYINDNDQEMDFSTATKIAESMELYARWKIKTFTYTINHLAGEAFEDEGIAKGDALTNAKVVKGVNYGTEIMETSRTFPYKRAVRGSVSFTIEDDTVIDFYYTELKAVGYTVKYGRYNTKGEWITLADSKTGTSTYDLRVVEFPVSIDGWYPAKNFVPFVLGADEKENIIFIEYLPYLTADCVVKHYILDEDEEYALYETEETIQIPIGETFIASPAAIVGYQLSQAEPSSKRATATDATPLTFNFYYDNFSITITADNASKVYDGEPLTCSTFTTSDLPDGYAVTDVVMTTASTITNPGTQANTIKSYKIKLNNSEVTMPSGSVTLVAGTLAVTNASFTVEKTSNMDEDDKVDVGDVIQYTITITNTGNVKLTKFTLTDTMAEKDGFEWTNESENWKVPDLAVNESHTITYQYTVQQSDVNAGSVGNTVTTSAAGANGETPEVTSYLEVDTIDVPGIAIKKSLKKIEDPNGNTRPADANGKYTLYPGDVVTYALTVQNTGNVTIVNIKIPDSLPGIEVDTDELPEGITYAGGVFTINSLALGAKKTITYTYTVTQNDVKSNGFTNGVTISQAETPDGVSLSDDSINAAENTVEIEIIAAPSLSITKKASKTENVKIGDIITYTLTIKNTGNIPITNINVSDSLEDIVPVSGSSFNSFNLAPQATKIITYTYTVTQNDLDNGGITNVATISHAETPDGSSLSSNDIDDENGTVEIELIAIKLTIRYWYQYAGGDVAAETYFYTYPRGSSYRVVSPSIENWVCRTPIISGTATKHTTVDVVYTRKLQKLTIYYWYNKIGGELASDTFIRSYVYGSTYGVQSPDISGWSYDTVRCTGVITEDTQYHVVYQQNTYKVTVKYLYITGGEAAPSKVLDGLKAGDAYLIESPLLEDCLASKTQIQGTMPGRNQEYTIIYTKLSNLDDDTTLHLLNTPASLGIGSVYKNIGDCFE